MLGHSASSLSYLSQANLLLLLLLLLIADTYTAVTVTVIVGTVVPAASAAALLLQAPAKTQKRMTTKGQRSWSSKERKRVCLSLKNFHLLIELEAKVMVFFS